MQTAYRNQGVRGLILFFFLLLGSYAAFSQGVQRPVAKEVTYGGDGSVQQVRYGYQEYLPRGYDQQPGKKWPLIIHMVGIGERGDGSVAELDTIAGIGIPKLIEQGRDYPFLIMSPQPTGDQDVDLGDDNPGTFHPDTVAHFVDYILATYPVDPDKIYVTAFSAAAQVAAKYIIANPGEVTAFIPIAGNLKPENLNGGICNLGNLPVWAFHNNIDNLIAPDGSIRFYKGLNSCKPAPTFPPKFTLYKVKANTHDAWSKTYNLNGVDPSGSNVDSTYDAYDISIFDWFLQYSKEVQLIADAGGDETIFSSEVILTGSGSPNNGLNFQWAQIGTTPNVATLSGQTTDTLIASNLIAGNYQFELTITDASNNTDKDTVNIYVRSFSADAGKDTAVTVPADIALQGQAINATEQELQSFNYQWTQILGTEVGDTTISNEPVAITNATAAVAGISLSTPGTYRFLFAISDAIGATARDTVDITARYSNDSLVVDAGRDTVVTFPVAAPVVLAGKASDPYNQIIGYQWSKLSGPTVTLTDENTANLTLTNPQSGEYLFALTVTNDNEGTASDTVKVSVGNFIASAGSDTTVTLPVDSVKLMGTAKDFVNTITDYAWTQIAGPDVVLLHTDSSTLILTELNKGTYTFEFTATNDINEQAKDTMQLLVNSTNDSLVVNAGQDKTVVLPVEQVILKGSATDPYNAITVYTWTQIAGATATTAGSDTNSLTVSQLQEGAYTFEFTASNDNEGTAKDTVVLTVVSKAEPDAELLAIVDPVQEAFPYLASHKVSVQVKNNGNVDISGFTATYQLDEQTPVTAQVDTTIAVGQTITYTFDQPADLTAYKNYMLQTSITLEGDVNTDNNTASINLQWLEVINQPNYSQDFEGGDGGWETISNQTGWQVGTYPGTDSQGWFTNLEGNYASNDTSYLVSPIFDFSEASTDPVISYDLWKDIDPSDTLYVSVSLDGGATWTVIQKVTGSNDPAGWRPASNTLEGAAGQANVIIRFEFVSDGEGNATGIGIDNINICQSAPTVEAIANKEVLIANPLEVPLVIGNADLSAVEIVAFSDNQEVIADNSIAVINENGAAKLVISADALGNANIMVLVQQACSASTTFMVKVTDKITGLEDELEHVAVAYPNPSEGVFYLDWKDRLPQHATVQVFNAKGGLIKNFGKVRSNLVVDLSTQAVGTYMLVIRAEGKTKTFRLIRK